MLNVIRIGKGGHPCLVPECSGKAFPECSVHFLPSKAPPSGEAGRKPGQAFLRPSPPPDRPERSGKGNLVSVGGGVSELGDLAVILLLYGADLEF